MSPKAIGTSYGHGGWSVGYLSHVGYYPAQRVAAAVQTNTDVHDDMLSDLIALIKDGLKTQAIRKDAQT